jgi:hypothetical protein
VGPESARPCRPNQVGCLQSLLRRRGIVKREAGEGGHSVDVDIRTRVQAERAKHPCRLGRQCVVGPGQHGPGGGARILG